MAYLKDVWLPKYITTREREREKSKSRAPTGCSYEETILI